MEQGIRYRIAENNNDFEIAKALFREYADSLDTDLCFQDFEGELKTLDMQYNKPSGSLWLVCDGSAPIACAGVRKLDEYTAELKRMYLKQGYRGRGIGKELLEHCLDTARMLGYKTLRLDTLKSMARAQELYRLSGFYDIEPYRYNPLEGTVYMEKVL